MCILIILCRMEKPLYLTAGKFFPLTLGTVISQCIKLLDRDVDISIITYVHKAS
ncbi:unnamed protein product [Acanthoscelides obtectus]|uniref:Uncharacterized protein n=1 Tax=Acanthoscelides obtectus TaxID=200917 RepID=A0A9P0MB07_ACAOB|nr:unnamed protein product [Acanthoscelides obtectus]CAK1670381.1 hypothetical protein AOBTE_LOCUS27597 [Acanthoscelides obtectus]